MRWDERVSMTVSFLCWVHSHTDSYPPPPSPPLPDPYRLTHHVGLLLSQLLVTDHTPDNLRVEGQDWTELTLEVFPAPTAATVSRQLYEQEATLQRAAKTTPEHHHAAAAATVVEVTTGVAHDIGGKREGDGQGEGGERKSTGVAVRVAASPALVSRSWIVRLHLLPGQRLVLDDNGKGTHTTTPTVRHMLPAQNCAVSHFPFSGPGTTPACRAGPVAEFRLPASAQERLVEGTILG